jgi:hypothetical protein
MTAKRALLMDGTEHLVFFKPLNMVLRDGRLDFETLKFYILFRYVIIQIRCIGKDHQIIPPILGAMPLWQNAPPQNPIWSDFDIP